MKEVIDTKSCTGCQACRMLCPNQCISMINDSEGFLIPSIEEEKCSNCGVCKSRCPENNHISHNNCLKVLGMRNKADELLFNSTSGGVFAGIASEMLKNPGNAVFGCAFDEDIVARHICITDIKNIKHCQGSKYVQSDVGNTYSEAKQFLDNGMNVFYTGTPCQIAGLYAYLGSDYNNLLTADLICHGVPSPLLFKRYIDLLSRKLGERVTYYSFRSKDRYGWGYLSKIKTKTKIMTVFPEKDPYFNAFNYNVILRECCYSCNYANVNRVADITLGDFWGVELTHPRFYDRRGVSVVLINTQKGMKCIEEISGSFEIEETDLETVVTDQYNLRLPSGRPQVRGIAYTNIYDEAVNVFSNDCFRTSLIVRFRAFIRRLLPFYCVKQIKRIQRIITSGHY